MKSLRTLACLLILILSAVPRHACAQSTIEEKIVGTWTGTLAFGGNSLRTVVHVARDGAGKLTATMDSPDQGAVGIPVERIGVDGGRLVLEVKSVQGRYEGRIDAAVKEIAGTWTQRGFTLPLTFRRSTGPTARARPQEPRPPFPYKAEDVTYPSAGSGVTLAATLTLPPGKGPFPGVMLVAGSGPQTRDEVVSGHKVFMVVADYLTRRGIAVLRADKRGIGKSTGNAATARIPDYALDAAGGVDYLKRRKEIDPRRIGILGHSEGAMVAPIVAGRLRSRDVRFVILLAGPAVRGRDLLLRQSELIARAEGVPSGQRQKAAALNAKLYDLAVREKDEKKAYKQMRGLIDAYVASLPAADRAEVQASLGDGQLKMLLSPWMRYFLAYDPSVALRTVRCSVLALFGSKDLQVPPGQNLSAARAALDAGGNRDATIRELPHLNHIFQHSRTGSPSEYGSLPETFSREALEIVTRWIEKRVIRRGP